MEKFTCWVMDPPSELQKLTLSSDGSSIRSPDELGEKDIGGSSIRYIQSSVSTTDLRVLCSFSFFWVFVVLCLTLHFSTGEISFVETLRERSIYRFYI